MEIDDDTMIGLCLSTGLSENEVLALPDEVIAQLKPHTGNEVKVAHAIRELGGSASINQIIVWIYKERKELLPRSNVNSACYRLEQKGLIRGNDKRPKGYTWNSGDIE